MEGLVNANKPQQLVFGNGVQNCLELDVVKCRRYAIEKAECLPVACVLDNIVPYNAEDGTIDFVYIDAGPGDFTDYTDFVPTKGLGG